MRMERRFLPLETSLASLPESNMVSAQQVAQLGFFHGGRVWGLGCRAVG